MPAGVAVGEQLVVEADYGADDPDEQKAFARVGQKQLPQDSDMKTPATIDETSFAPTREPLAPHRNLRHRFVKNSSARRRESQEDPERGDYDPKTHPTFSVYRPGNRNHREPDDRRDNTIRREYGTHVERPDRREYGGDRREHGSARREYGAERREYGPERREYGPERREYGGDRREYAGDRREYGPERREYGPERREYGGDRREYGGDRREYPGDRREYGAERREYGGDRREYGTERREYGPERREYGAERREYGGDRREYAGDRRDYKDRHENRHEFSENRTVPRRPADGSKYVKRPPSEYRKSRDYDNAGAPPSGDSVIAQPVEQPNKIYIGNLQPDATPHEVERTFREFGDIRDMDYKGRFAFIDFFSQRAARNAVANMDGALFCGDRIVVQPYRTGLRFNDSRRPPGHQIVPPPRMRPTSYSAGRTEYRLVIGNLDDRVSWQDLKDFARNAGEVNFANVFTKDFERIGIVEYFSRGPMERALRELHGRRLYDKRVWIQEDTSKKSRQEAGYTGNQSWQPDQSTPNPPHGQPARGLYEAKEDAHLPRSPISNRYTENGEEPRRSERYWANRHRTHNADQPGDTPAANGGRPERDRSEETLPAPLDRPPVTDDSLSVKGPSRSYDSRHPLNS